MHATGRRTSPRPSCTIAPTRSWRATPTRSPSSSPRAPRSRPTSSPRDPEERTGLRATLNYGHTLAHALETVGRLRAPARRGGRDRPRVRRRARAGARARRRRRPSTSTGSCWSRSASPRRCPTARALSQLLAVMRTRQEGEGWAHVRAPRRRWSRDGRRPTRQRPRRAHSARWASTPTWKAERDAHDSALVRPEPEPVR